MSKEIGTIQEQGFVAGANLGFSPLSEAERKKLEDQMALKESQQKQDK